MFRCFQQNRAAGSGRGRQVKYDAKRQTVLSTAHLVEIDLHRTEAYGGWWHQITGFWSAVRIAALQNCIRLICERRCRAFCCLCPDQEPVVDLHSILEQVHEAALNLAINYTQPFHPSATMILPDSDFADGLSSEVS